jgi:hypothetical protein
MVKGQPVVAKPTATFHLIWDQRHKRWVITWKWESAPRRADGWVAVEATQPIQQRDAARLALLLRGEIESWLF